MPSIGRGFFSTGTPTLWMNIIAVPVGVLVLVVGMPIVISIEVYNATRRPRR